MTYVPPPNTNPYASPIAPAVEVAVVPKGDYPSKLDCMRAYNYIFENPDWMTSVLLLGVLSLAAIIPGVSFLLQLIYLGYGFEIIGSLLQTQGKQYPKFDFGRFGDYLSRGIWPFLVNLVSTLVILPIAYAGMAIGVLIVVGLASAGGDEFGPVLAVLGGVIVGVLFLALMLVISMFLIPVMLRAGLAQDFVAAFKFDWIMDFVRKMWIDMLVAGLFMAATGIVLEIVGLLALCIGLFFVIPIFMLAYAHLGYQLYVIYLARGGQPVMAKVVIPPTGMPQPPSA